MIPPNLPRRYGAAGSVTVQLTKAGRVLTVYLINIHLFHRVPGIMRSTEDTGMNETSVITTA